MRYRLPAFLTAIAATVLAACADVAGPPPMRQGPLANLTDRVQVCGVNILAQSPLAPPLRTYTFSLWAVQGGDERSVVVSYTDGRQFLKFTVRKGTVLRRPNGTVLAPRDSIRITGVIDPVLLMATFQPSGLQFENAPARLRIDYAHANLDLDGSGVVSGLEGKIFRECGRILWQQDDASEWLTLPRQELQNGQKYLEAQVPHFSRYAVGW